jgi:hypothetical protein
MRVQLGTETTENWYSHIPKAICEHEDITMLWTDEYVAIPSDRNVIRNEHENKLQHKNLSIESQLLWNMKRFVILVVCN